MVEARKERIGRRQFLRAVGVGASALAAAPLSTETRADVDEIKGEEERRYRETDHVKTFYRLARYPMK